MIKPNVLYFIMKGYATMLVIFSRESINTTQKFYNIKLLVSIYWIEKEEKFIMSVIRNSYISDNDEIKKIRPISDADIIDRKQIIREILSSTIVK